MEARILAAALPLLALAAAGCIGESLVLQDYGPGGPPDFPVRDATFAEYHDSAALDAELLRVAADHPTLVAVEELGRSVQGKPILLARVTAPGGAADKPVAFLDGCHHGNENQGCEAPLFVARFLADNYAGNATVRWMLEEFEVHLVPNVNPDGHDAQTRVNANGVNLNRNYPTDHGNPLGLSYPVGEPVSAETWTLPAVCAPSPQPIPFQCPVRPSENGGFRPLDQPETAAIAGHMQALKDEGRFAFYLTFHTAAHSIVIPWVAMVPPGEPTMPPGRMPAPHEERMQEVVQWVYDHTTYDAGHNSWFDSSSNLGYAASGTSQDWAYDCCGVPSMTFETFDFAEGIPEDVNYWGANVLPITLKLLVNTDHLMAWEQLDREFPYPEAWQGVHWWAEGAPEQGGAPRATL